MRLFQIDSPDWCGEHVYSRQKKHEEESLGIVLLTLPTLIGCVVVFGHDFVLVNLRHIFRRACMIDRCTKTDARSHFLEQNVPGNQGCPQGASRR